MDKPNIIFIVMDALRAKNLGCYGYKRSTSPNIDSLAERGVLFLDAFSSNNATDKSILSILSGRHTLLREGRDVMLSKKELNSFFNSGGILLSETLKKKGYKTYFLKEIYGWQKKGFDYFYSITDSNKNKGFWEKYQINYRSRNFFRKIVHYIPKNLGDRIKAKYGRNKSLRATEDAIKIIKKSKKKNEKFFMWIDYNDTHIPYNPKEFTGKFKVDKSGKSFFRKIQGKKYNPLLVEYWEGAFNRKDSIEDIIARYDGTIYYDDYLIGKVIETLKKENLFENAIIFFFSDHGESFDEHEIYFDHHGLYDVSMNFPLIISGNKIPKNKKIKGFVQHEDFVPTILDLLGIKYDASGFDGKSFIPLIKQNKKIRDSIFMEEGDKAKKRAIRTDKYKYIEAVSKEDALCLYCNQIHGGLQELYDLKKDPKENHNVIEEKKKIARSLKNKLYKEIKEYKMKNEKRRIKKRLSQINNKPYKQI